MIDTRLICGLFALGAWHKVMPRTASIRPYNLMQPILNNPSELSEELFSLDVDVFEMSYQAFVKKTRSEFDTRPAPDNAEKCWVYSSPSANDAICFVDAETGEVVWMPLLEVKAFRLSADEDL